MKDYKKILEGVVNIINTTEKSDIGFANICTYIGENCPELQEGKDERIRKALIRFHKSTIDVDGIKGEDIVAWLEKQGEQKPVISYDALREGIAHFGITQYQIDNWLKKYVDVKKQGEQKPTEWSSEQSNTLQTDDVPYESSTAAPLRTGAIGFDGVPMESKPCEQKSSWSEEDEKKFSNILALLWGGVNRHYNAPDLSTWFKSLKDRVQPQPKPDWSKEDEKMIGNIRTIITKYAFSQSAVDVNGDSCEKEYIDADNWLKNLKDRVQPQKQEWSYNDKIIIETIIQEIEKIPSEEFIDNAKCRCLDWLRYRTKSLRPHSQWKPSERQKEALLWCVVHLGGADKQVLGELLEQLNKL